MISEWDPLPPRCGDRRVDGVFVDSGTITTRLAITARTNNKSSTRVAEMSAIFCSFNYEKATNQKNSDGCLPKRSAVTVRTLMKKETSIPVLKLI